MPVPLVHLIFEAPTPLLLGKVKLVDHHCHAQQDYAHKQATQKAHHSTERGCNPLNVDKLILKHSNLTTRHALPLLSALYQAFASVSSNLNKVHNKLLFS